VSLTSVNIQKYSPTSMVPAIISDEMTFCKVLPSAHKSTPAIQVNIIPRDAAAIAKDAQATA
jgi:hypothetical protein